MFLEIELLYFIIMIAVFIVLMLLFKVPSGLSLMASAVVGLILSTIFSHTSFELRYLVEGTFGYFDTILTITTAMVFMGALQASGALEYISAVLVKTFRKFPSILLIAFIIIIMFPAMVTGSSLASAISAGALVAPIMIKWGIPKAKTGAIVALGSILGMVAPPVNVPAMVICDVVDIAFTNFTLPLLLLSIPVAVFGVLLLGRKYVKPIAEEDISKVVNTDILKELNVTCCIPLFTLIILIVLEMIFPRIFGSLAMPGMFVISTIIAFFTGRRLPFWKKGRKLLEEEDGEKIESVIDVVREGIKKSFGAMGLLMGVGMFMEVIALNGVRSYFVTNAMMLPAALRYVSMALTLPIFGGISAFGSASILGGPFVMAMYTSYTSVTLTCGFSLLAATGEFLPPTAMSSTFASNIVGEKGWSKVTKAAIPAICVLFGYNLVYILVFAKIIFDEKLSKNANTAYLILFAITMAVSILASVVYVLIASKSSKAKDLALEANEVETSNDDQTSNDVQTTEAVQDDIDNEVIEENNNEEEDNE